MRNVVLTLLLAVACSVGARPATAQSPQQPTPPASPADQHQHAGQHPEAAAVPHEREGSGTSWLPEETPMYAVHTSPLGGWQIMLHGAALLQYMRDEKPRGVEQFGSINWFMAAARRTFSSSDLTVRGMFSLEPATIRGCGYPDLLASGEVCEGEAIIDRQHPHDLMMELAGVYDRRLSDRFALQLYGGIAGEPALGPVAFPHRPSAMMNPLAPITHHWLDASHITFGVVTAGLFGERWKLESSVFNGREPDEHRYDLDLAALDSYSARLAFLPRPRWALQISAGHLDEAEEHAEGGRVDVDRLTASAIYHRPSADAGLLSTTVAWGRNVEEGQATSGVLAEATQSIRDRDVFFGRIEFAQKTGHDLDIHDAPDEVFTVGKLQAGYSRYFAPLAGWRPGIGGSVSISMVPQRLRDTYGGRAPLGFAVFLSLRPAGTVMRGMHGG